MTELNMELALCALHSRDVLGFLAAAAMPPAGRGYSVLLSVGSVKTGQQRHSVY